MAAVLALLAVGFVALLRHANRMPYGAPPQGVTIGEKVGGDGARHARAGRIGPNAPAPLEALLNQVVKVWQSAATSLD